MRKHHRTALLVAVCAATTTTGGLLTPAAAAPMATERDGPDIAELPGGEIAEKASNELNSARSLRLKMKAPDLRLNLTLDEKANCSGKVTVPGKGSVRLIKHGDTVWLKPDAAFWKAQLGPEEGAAAAKKFQGRYIKGSARDDDLGGKGLATACDLDAFRAASGATRSPGPRWKRGPQGEVGGHRSVPVTSHQDKARVTMHVSADGKPYPLRLERRAGGNHDEIDLGRFDRPVPRGVPDREHTVSVEELRRHFQHSQQDEPPSKSV
ncbi:hypothetical protein ACH4LN_26240 [Streptomyces albus]|uniref:hypothetical protein n=1 Tax=Streptomyces TaxID=1883 RepID=UPI00034E308B|nr:MULTISPECIES: hypothetical protein [Streptomyces]EPD89265.1 hypothetical protein HMPREF1486_06499 [Streptomyces sp. HPH0547]UVN55203.1 hypothetical protein NR995_12240 [Streptomyces albus]GHJ19502.1 hypothetical protein TPA0909_11160 [Streptomyces albus]